MNIENYRHQHNEIMGEVTTVRDLIKAGIAPQADAIARRLARMGAGIKFHMAAKDTTLYPALQGCADARVAAMGRRYQEEMSGLREAFGRFVEKWRAGEQIAANPEGFRDDANCVFKALHERLQRENRELYPAAEKL